MTGPRVAVVGGGISGMGAARALARAGCHPWVVEQGDSLGGRCGATWMGRRPVMTGGKNIGRRYHRLRSFLSEYGALADLEEFGTNASRIVDGRIVTLDSTHMVRSLRDLARLGSARDVARLARLAQLSCRTSESRYVGAPEFRRVAREHDHATMDRHFDPAVTRNLLDAVTLRQNGAHADEVYLGTFNTNLATIFDTYDQPRVGLHTVFNGFSRDHDVELGSMVTELVPGNHGVTVGVRREGVERFEHVDGVVVATPAWVTAPLLRPFVPIAAQHLDRIRYFPATVALVEYDRDIYDEDVRALTLEGMACTNAGSYGKHDRRLIRYTFNGRQARRDVVDESVVAEWLSQAEDALRPHTHIDMATRLCVVTRHWPAAYCGYSPYHADTVDTVEALMGRTTRIRLAGDWVQGMTLEACYRSGEGAGRNLAEELVP